MKRACAVAGISRSIFYYWRPRFLQGGYEALETTLSRAPKKPHQVDPCVAEKVIALKIANPQLGKVRIANLINGEQEKKGRHVRLSPTSKGT